MLKRIFDAGFLPWESYRTRYAEELDRVKAIARTRREVGGGGNYYYTQPLRVGQTFARAVIVDAMEGRTLYRDAFTLLGSAKRSTFDGMAARLGVA